MNEGSAYSVTGLTRATMVNQKRLYYLYKTKLRILLTRDKGVLGTKVPARISSKQSDNLGEVRKRYLSSSRSQKSISMLRT